MISIGDITVDDEIAKEYFLDCFKNKESVYNEYTRRNCGSMSCDLADFLGLLETIREIELIKLSNNETQRTQPGYHLYYLCPRTPTAVDFAKWYLNYKKENNNGI